MKYRSRTNDFISHGKVWDIYDIKTNKKDVPAVKKRISKRYRYIRVIKRKDGYYILVRR